VLTFIHPVFKVRDCHPDVSYRHLVDYEFVETRTIYKKYIEEFLGYYHNNIYGTDETKDRKVLLIRQKRFEEGDSRSCPKKEEKARRRAEKKFEKCKTEDKVLQKNAYSVLEKFCDGDKRTEDKTSSPSTSKDEVSSMIRGTLNG
jgi:hypothetical protein